MHLSLPSRTIPSQIPDSTEIFAIGDVHGQSDALDLCLKHIKDTDKPEGVERVLVFLGDFIDRGPNSLKVVETAMNAAALTNSDVVHLLPGNHELLLLDALGVADFWVWVGNGGNTVLAEIDEKWRSLKPSQIDDELRHELHSAISKAMPVGFEQLMVDAPSHIKIGDLIFVHAGFDVRAKPEDALDRGLRHLQNPTHWAWIRNSFLLWRGGFDWNEEAQRYVWGNTVVVHGHTPAVRKNLSDAEDLQICDGIDEFRAVCLDVSASSRPQVGCSHFFIEDGQTLMQIHAFHNAGVA